MHPVGIGLVGAGPWGLTLARAFQSVAGAKLRWICEHDAERRARAGAAHPGARLAADLDEVLAADADMAIAVAVDSPRHHAVGMRVLNANRHLYLEKPLALSCDEAEELHAAANARARVLSVGHVLLHHPAIRSARQIVAAGLLGDPLYFKSKREAVGPPRTPGSAWWALAPHDVSLAIELLESVPATVSATAGGFTGPEDDSVASATLSFADGRTAHIHVARFAAEKIRRVSIAGTRQTLTFDELAPEHPLQISQSAGATPTRIPVDTTDPLLAQCAHFVACVSRGDPAGSNGAHALAVVRVLDAGARSMRAAGAPVAVT